MTLEIHPRLNLRRSIVTALSGGGQKPYLIPQVGPNVFDSRMDPLVHNSNESNVCALIVYVDDTAIGTQTQMSTIEGASWLFEVCIDICVVNNAMKGVDTTAETEEALDQIEWAVLHHLFNPISDTAKLFAKTYDKVHDVKSLRTASSKGNDRIAHRSLLIAVETNGRCRDYRDVFPPLNTVGLTVDRDGEQLSAPITDMQA